MEGRGEEKYMLSSRARREGETTKVGEGWMGGGGEGGETSEGEMGAKE